MKMELLLHDLSHAPHSYSSPLLEPPLSKSLPQQHRAAHRPLPQESPKGKTPPLQLATAELCHEEGGRDPLLMMMSLMEQSPNRSTSDSIPPRRPTRPDPSPFVTPTPAGQQRRLQHGDFFASPLPHDASGLGSPAHLTHRVHLIQPPPHHQPPPPLPRRTNHHLQLPPYAN